MVLLASACMVSARSLVLTLSNNTKVYYLLGGEVNPVMRFVDGKMTVNTDTYAFSNIKNFFISEEDDPTAIEEVKPVASRFDGNTLVVEGEAKAVKVYGTDGKRVDAPVVQLDGHVSVDMSGLRKGTYIINIGKDSVKVQKK